MYGNTCFENFMRNITIEENCDCPMECNSLTYSFSFVSTPFDANVMCPTNFGGDRRFLMKEFYKNKSPPQFVRKLKEFKQNISADEADYCKNNIKYRAEIIFRLATDSIPVNVMTRRLSFFDQLSAFGNFNNFFLISLKRLKTSY